MKPCTISISAVLLALTLIPSPSLSELPMAALQLGVIQVPFTVHDGDGASNGVAHRILEALNDDLPRVGFNIIVNDPQVPFPAGLIGRSEVTIAALNEEQLVIGWNDADGFCGPPFGAPCAAPPVPGLSGFGTSSDEGDFWVDGGAPPPLPFGPGIIITRGDPSLATSGEERGPVYYANLATGSGVPASGLIVHRGHFDDDGLFVWDPTKTRFLPAPPGSFYDKELLAVEPFGQGTRAYLSYTNFLGAAGLGQIELFRTVDGGDTWIGPTVVRPAIGTFPNGTVVQGSEPAVAPDRKTVYVAWEQGPVFVGGAGVLSYEIRVARSDDGGATFGPGMLVSAIHGMFLRAAPAGYNRGSINDFPRIAVAMDGDNESRVYVVYHSAKAPLSTDTDVFLSYSDDKGATWTQVPVSTVAGAQEFWPDVDVGDDDTVVVQYYRGVPGVTPHPVSPGLLATTFVDTYLSVSNTSGTSFEPAIRVSTHTSNWRTAFSNIIPNFGDYNSVTVRGESAFCAWAGADEVVMIGGIPRNVPSVIFSRVTDLEFDHDIP